MKSQYKSGQLIVLGESKVSKDGKPGSESHEERAEKPHEMIGTCPAMLRVFQFIRKVATTNLPVLVTGATGTGKELVAQAIHQRSPRADGPFTVLNCGAIPRDLLESEFFGHEKGAFTGAHRTVIGKAELAQRGTLFLDEVGELPLELQVKLLRFLQDYSFERVGGREKIEVDVRVISATNRNLKELMAAGRFREDLYFRLNGITLELPDLKDRGDDVLIMANFLLQNYAADIGKDFQGFSPEALKTIRNHAWPGNIRELINLVRRAVVMGEGPWVTPGDLGLEWDRSREVSIPKGLGLREAMAHCEARLVSETLASSGWNVSVAARALKTSRSMIYLLVKKYNLH